MAAHFFYDLSVSDTQLEAETQKERTGIAISLGYDGLASPHQAGPKLTAADKCKIRQLELEEVQAATRGLRMVRGDGGAAPDSHAHRLVQLTRLNVPVDDTNVAQESFNNAAVLRSYDLVAAQPLSERAFAFACTSLEVDIISIDLTRRLNYRFKSDLVKAAMRRGVHFEILYAPLLREPGSRRQIFANAQALARETRGRALILSSGARMAIELRGPYDVVNLGTFLGLTEAQAHAAVGKNAAAVVEHARRRRAFRGTLSLRSFQPGDEHLLATTTGAQPMDTDDQK